MSSTYWPDCGPVFKTLLTLPRQNLYEVEEVCASSVKPPPPRSATGPDAIK